MNPLKLININIFLVYFFSSFTVWFAFSPYLRFNILLIVVLFSLILLYRKKLSPIAFPSFAKKEDLCIVSLLILMSISFGVNFILNPQPKLISNYLGLMVVFVILYYIYNAIIYTYGTICEIIKGCAYGGLLLMIIVVSDGFLANFADIRIHDWFVWGYEGNASYFERAFWVTPCSPCVEPAEASLYVNCLFPFCLLYFKKMFLRISSIVLFGLSQFTLFSSAGLFTALSGFLLIYIIYSKNKIIKIVLPFLIILIVSCAYSYYSEYFESLAIVDKITLSGNTSSDASRQISWLTAISDSFSSPLWGMGPGYGKSILEEGYLSSFLLIAGDFGLVAFFVFVYYWYCLFLRTITLPMEYRPYILYSFYAVTVEAMISDILNVFVLWLLVPILYIMSKVDEINSNSLFVDDEDITYRKS